MTLAHHGPALVASLGLVAGFAAAGCSGTAGQEASADCSDQVRAGGVVYTSHGVVTEHEADRYSPAEVADCDDQGPDPVGPVFTGTEGRVTTWAFAGYPAAKVLGVRHDRHSFVVFVADSVGPQEEKRIHEALTISRR